MKDNTSQARSLLEQAARVMPGDFALREVRFHIQQALSKMGHVEKNRDKRAEEAKKVTQAQSWNEMLRDGVQNPLTSKRTVDIINQMIEGEHKKLEEIIEKKNNQKKGKQEDEGETLYG